MTEKTANTLRYIGTAILLAGIAAMLLGCGTMSTAQITKVPVPVACQETEPGRPVMPTEALAPEAPLDAFVQAAIAEIERREGYELKLRTALQACIAPITP